MSSLSFSESGSQSAANTFTFCFSTTITIAESVPPFDLNSAAVC